MPKIPRYLITTADERTWKFDRSVIFLGEWCRRHDRSHVWKSMDAIVAEPYGVSTSSKNVDYSKARSLEDRLFPEFYKVLNRYHSTQHGERYWRIVLGHWFRRYVNVMLNRIRTVEQCFDTYNISGTTVFSDTRPLLAQPDSISAACAFDNDQWNNVLTAKIIMLLGNHSTAFEVIPYSLPFNRQTSLKREDVIVKRSILRRIFRKAFYLTNIFVKDHEGFIINSYLPRLKEFQLHIALGQWPQLWTSPKFQVREAPNSVLRKCLNNELTFSYESNLEKIVYEMIFELIPVCYLEGYSDLKRFTQKQAWPKNPKFIFTSNNFDKDDVFKFWAAAKIEFGSKYLVGQHGNNYGTSRYMNPSIEEITADKFLTWGWTDEMPQHIKAFVFKTAGKKKERFNPRGGLLLIELCVGPRIDTWDNYFEFANYFDEQKRFVSHLSNIPRGQLTVRLHAEYVKHQWCEEARWAEFDPSIDLEKGGIPIGELIERSRLIVHSYDSTGIIETLSQNIPTLAFWQNNLDHLRDGAKQHYQVLVDAGIVHFTPASVAQKVNEVWDDVLGWWARSDVQEARNYFCERYAMDVSNPVDCLARIIKN